MKIFNFDIKYHKHSWYWRVDKPFRNEFGNYSVKIMKTCICNPGYFADVLYIETTTPITDVYIK